MIFFKYKTNRIHLTLVKRALTLFMLLIFLLNVVGYYGIYVGLKARNVREMQARFDNEEYATHQEVTIKVPLTVPYATDSREYSRVDGEFEHQGEIYRMVKQRLLSDTLYIVCVKDETSKDIKQALVDYVKTFSDKPTSEKGSSKTLQNFIKDYIAASTILQTSNDGWNHSLTSGTLQVAYQPCALALTSPPPKG